MTLLKHFIFSNIWISLAAISITWIQAYYYNYKLNTNLILLIFLGTYVAYNYIYLASSIINPKRMDSAHREWIQKHKTTFVISSGISFILSIYLFFELNNAQKIQLIIAGLLSLFYILPGSTTFGLRWIPYIKTPTILITWVIITTVLPQIKNQFSHINVNTVLFAIPFILAWLLIFDLRDYSKDLSSIKTWPQKLGIQGTQLIAYILIILAFIILLSSNDCGLNHFSSIVIFGLYSLAIIRLKHMAHHYYNIIFDGLPILWAAFLLMEQLITKQIPPH